MNQGISQRNKFVIMPEKSLSCVPIKGLHLSVNIPQDADQTSQLTVEGVVMIKSDTHTQEEELACRSNYYSRAGIFQ